jgi:hypothetical protein
VYHPELNPLRLPLAFLSAGLAAPATSIACELGFGQGVSANLHAAASTTKWFGTDFSSAQAGFAQELAAVSGAGARFFDQSFAEFCGRTDLPEFDFIALHGVWSWISDENRQILVDFFRRKLKVGGVVYVSYNTSPGYAAMIPVREVLRGHAESVGAGQGLANKVTGAIAFAEKLIAASPIYAQAHPHIVEQLKVFRGMDSSYVAHEYFNRDWAPMSFARVTEWLAPAKLDYACSANYFNMVDAWHLRPEQQALLEEIPDTTFRETARDLMANQSFRTDYWVRGLRRLSPLERLEALSGQRVMLIRPAKDIPLKAVGALGEFALVESVCAPILDALGDHRPKTLGEIEHAVRGKGLTLTQIAEVALTLIRIGGLSPVQGEAAVRAAKQQTDKLNAFLCDRARTRTDIGFLASPVTGSAFKEAGGRVVQLFLHGMAQGKQQPAELAAHVWQIFQAQGVAILNQGKPLATTEENLAALNSQAAFFTEKQLPVLKALQIV